MDKIKPEWKKRGFVSNEEISFFESLSDSEINELLHSNEATERTTAASILGKRRISGSIFPLIEALKKEKALYSKIAISEALGNMGEAAALELVPVFGKIGTNQHKTLPTNPFEKWNYPLPRDIVARTVTKIGETALAPILQSIPKMEKEALSEAIDAIGFISFYSKNKSGFRPIINLLNIYKNDDLIVWKIIRALQSFPSAETEKTLEHHLVKHSQPAIKWEAARSLGQICKNIHECLLKASNSQDELLKSISLLAIKRITGKNDTLQ